MSYLFDKIVVKDEVEYEDKDVCVKDDYVDVERKVLEIDGWYWVGFVGIN